MAQNIYDDPEFFAGYTQLDRQVRGLDGAAEWTSLQAMLPAITDARVLDLGCGFGWFSRWAIEQGATSAHGIDLSERMLERARADTDSLSITYERADLDVVRLPAKAFDLVFSSLTLHYVEDVARLFDSVADALCESGSFVFSVEHPILSAPSKQQFEHLDHERTVWPLENYLVEGTRATNWFADGVIKHHRTIATYANQLVAAGLAVQELCEWGPDADAIAANPHLARDLHRPWFLLVRATKNQQQQMLRPQGT